MIAKCGVNCSKCAAFKENAHNDSRDHETIKGFLDYHKQVIEKLNCDGCQCQNDSECVHLNPECEVRKCAKQRNLEDCGDCIDYPCKLINKVYMIIEQIIERIQNESENPEADYQKYVKPYLGRKMLDVKNYRYRLKRNSE